MLIEFFDLWLGAYNYFVSADSYAYEEYKQIYLIMVSAITILGCFLVMSEICKGFISVICRKRG